ncbi:MAG TPA: DUF983 domain-containing protein [Paracoccus solventivorans]|uniref:DUF983 domain-containing protein n=1 Tax=Paracoccus solventivorans TaxID=53463 RepID=A0A832QWH2_9RHOB|nr:DUF983 domain-containing protein [Paracoccus solventivorans]HHW34319.1 DUF983 domain-containing protein [Paracoccus solventivorans]HMM07598.1 DUF983 domain-containing protein [Paracoccus solventivorans]
MTALSDPALPDRPLGEAMRRGASGRCPSCGDARMFSGYLRVKDHCSGCGEALHHHRADDGPAYLTILIVSHIATALLLAIYMIYRPSTELLVATFLGGALVASLILLPIIKGGFVGMQWAKRMHGFGGQPDRAPEP